MIVEVMFQRVPSKSARNFDVEVAFCAAKDSVNALHNASVSVPSWYGKKWMCRVNRVLHNWGHFSTWFMEQERAALLQRQRMTVNWRKRCNPDKHRPHLVCFALWFWFQASRGGHQVDADGRNGKKKLDLSCPPGLVNLGLIAAQSMSRLKLHSL